MSDQLATALKWVIYSFPIFAFITLTMFGWIVLQIVKNRGHKNEILGCSASDQLSEYDERQRILHEPEMVGKVLEHDMNIGRSVDKLMLGLDASSAFLIRFHNGSVFSTNNPVWRFSITYESANAGVAQIAERTKDVMVSTVTNLFCPLFSGQIPPGIEEVKTTEQVPIKVFHANTGNIQDFALRGFLEGRTIEDLYYAPIYDKDNNPIGILCVDYTFGWGAEKPTDDKIVDQLVMTGSMISFDVITRNEKVNRFIAEQKKAGTRK